MVYYSIKYEIVCLNADGNWSYCSFEKNKIRAIKIAKEIANEGKKVKVKLWNGKVIWEN